jgi:HAD superfamily hydrolase (TIGR01549 family)
MSASARKHAPEHGSAGNGKVGAGVRTSVDLRPSASLGNVGAVLLDMDDTLFDHSLTCRAAIAALRSNRRFLRRRPLDDLWQAYLRRLDADGSSVGPGGVSKDEARRERWRALALACGTNLTPGEVGELSREYRAHYQRLRRPVPGARQLLERLHGRVKVVVVTNNEVAEQEEKVRFLGVGPLLDGLVVSEAVGAAKPDPRIFRVALDAAGVGAESATMLGDSWGSDVVGAIGVGVRPVWFNRFGLPRPGPEPASEVRALRPIRPVERLLLGVPEPDRTAASSPAPRAL